MKWRIFEREKEIYIDKVETGDRLVIEEITPQSKLLAQRVTNLLNAAEPLTLDQMFAESEHGLDWPGVETTAPQFYTYSTEAIGSGHDPKVCFVSITTEDADGDLLCWKFQKDPGGIGLTYQIKGDRVPCFAYSQEDVLAIIKRARAKGYGPKDWITPNNTRLYVFRPNILSH